MGYDYEWQSYVMVWGSDLLALSNPYFMLLFRFFFESLGRNNDIPSCAAGKCVRTTYIWLLVARQMLHRQHQYPLRQQNKLGRRGIESERRAVVVFTITVREHCRALVANKHCV